jgi:hypothetical protein
MKPNLLIIAASLTLVALISAKGSCSDNSDLDRWFLQATSFNSPGTPKHISKPDFLGSADWRSCAGDRFSENAPNFYGVWSLLTYDRTHHIAFARGMTDQCSLAVFQAPPPGTKTADADLSRYGTVRGLHIGSSYSQVLALYGPPVKRGSHFVTSYSASVPAIAVNRKHVDLDERITLVIQSGFVSSISIYIEESGLVLDHLPAGMSVSASIKKRHKRI